MNVRQITLRNFRNYSEFETEFTDKVNVIIGDNAQGKTNLLEAVYFMSAGRSFRAKSDRELISFDSDAAYIRADISAGGREQKLEAYLFRQKRRQLLANDVKLRTAGELCGRLRAVLFCPDDLQMVREGAAVRRRLMDSCLCQLRPRYAAALTENNRLLEHKTRILRDHHEKPSLLYTLDDFDLRLAQTGAELIYYRAAYAALLSEKASKIHREFSGGRENLTLTYKTVKTIPDPRKKPAELLPHLQEHLRDHRRAELETGTCLSGAHKDDLEIDIDGIPARSFASQGQARTAALSVKLAEREIHYDDGGEYPLLLLDDVLSELDMTRQNFVLNKIGEGQVFITCCEDGRLKSRTGGKVLHIDGGRLA
ncbi:DNA replication and repair protein RecF [Sporobacter termitidis DSM 10068]|uniref:DNA replication and repair protein RecF n=1 Tax=Sporobacter termitidis DSM 10068 TaxID=1123282 RepID=A0A1M5VU66_9FIRM|nr:DNA replication/repair protein RecF [Sporobacter termitidis]SHH78812.1 DNA replication and repair protein RecF [Sporobacter termitidis DSM 10068]